jgi:hypothetical protein
MTLVTKTWASDYFPQERNESARTRRRKAPRETASSIRKRQPPGESTGQAGSSAFEEAVEVAEDLLDIVTIGCLDFALEFVEARQDGRVDL